MKQKAGELWHSRLRGLGMTGMLATLGWPGPPEFTAVTRNSYSSPSFRSAMRVFVSSAGTSLTYSATQIIHKYWSINVQQHFHIEMYRKRSNCHPGALPFKEGGCNNVTHCTSEVASPNFKLLHNSTSFHYSTICTTCIFSIHTGTLHILFHFL